jgi:ABC-type molybdate transport system permease subunit
VSSARRSWSAANIPGKTQTLPLALFDAWQAGRDRDALVYAVWLSLAAFALLALVGAWGGRLATGRGDRS